MIIRALTRERDCSCGIPFQCTADLHIHTCHSDGLSTPEEIAKLAHERAIDVIAITDHDTVTGAQWAWGYNEHLVHKGMREIGDGSRSPSPNTVFTGVELSCKTTRGNQPDVVHLLGLCFNPFLHPIVDLCNRLQEARRCELRRKVEHVRNLGFPLSLEAEARVMRNSWWGKGDLARELVLANVGFDDVHSAYQALWQNYDEGVYRNEFATPEEASRAVRDSWGAVFLAHPFRSEMGEPPLSRNEVLERIDALLPYIDGVECFYRSQTFADCIWLAEYCKAQNLLISGGSDHHDAFSRNRLGTICSDADNTDCSKYIFVNQRESDGQGSDK